MSHFNWSVIMITPTHLLNGLWQKSKVSVFRVGTKQPPRNDHVHYKEH